MAGRAVLGAGAVLALVLALAGCGSTSGRAAPTTVAATTTTALVPPSTTAPPTTVAPTTTTTVDPGQLPQTTAIPDSGATLTRSMQVLWRAIVTDDPDAALDVFFPRTAYLRMKTGVIPNPSGDYADRLLAFYRLDIHAYHQYLGAGASGAVFQSDATDTNYAAWIPAGACENAIGYWHLPGVRLVYTEGGVTSSFGVFSLISWHSVWYVVHLGPNPRPSDTGTVDQPASGPGTPGPPGGC